MIFFRLDRPLQRALIGAALVAGPACGSTGDDAAHDADAAADEAADADADFAPDTDATADTDADFAADADEATDADAAIDTSEAVDPVPGPLCTDLPTYALATTNLVSEPERATAEVRLSGEVRPFGDPCSRPVCLAVTPAGGEGTIGDYVAVDSRTVRFTYTNPGLRSWAPVRLDLAWQLYCSDPTGGESEGVVHGTAWACRDDRGDIRIVGDADECAPVVDPPPPPMARGAGAARDAGERGFRLQAHPRPDGSIRLVARDFAGTCKWTAVGGRLERVNGTEAVFRPDPAARTMLVQVAVPTPDGLAVRVWRRPRG